MFGPRIDNVHPFSPLAAVANADRSSGPDWLGNRFSRCQVECSERCGLGGAGATSHLMSRHHSAKGRTAALGGRSGGRESDLQRSRAIRRRLRRVDSSNSIARLPPAPRGVLASLLPARHTGTIASELLASKPRGSSLRIGAQGTVHPLTSPCCRTYHWPSLAI